MNGAYDGIRQADDAPDDEAEKRDWLRDMFAAHALTSLARNPNFSPSAAAERAYAYADAMLAARGAT